jgi:hypothetical protein
MNIQQYRTVSTVLNIGACVRCDHVPTSCLLIVLKLSGALAIAVTLWILHASHYFIHWPVVIAILIMGFLLTVLAFAAAMSSAMDKSNVIAKVALF